MSERVMMGLGEFRFDVDTIAYQDLKLNQSWRWQEQSRLGREPALQFVGTDTGSIDFDGVIYPGFAGGLGQVEAMRALADTGKPQLLVDGHGRVLGKWCIVAVGDTRSVLADNGQPRKIEFSIKLKAYGEDDARSAAMIHQPAARQRVAPALAPQTGVSGASATLNALEAAAAALPQITADMPPAALQTALTATQGIAGELAQAVGAAAASIEGMVTGAVSGLVGGALNLLPVTAVQALGALGSAVGDVMVVAGSLRSIASGTNIMPSALVRGVAGMDGSLRLAVYSTTQASGALRDTSKTLGATAGMANAGDFAGNHAGNFSARQNAAITLNQVADATRNFANVCTQAQACTTHLKSKWGAYHA